MAANASTGFTYTIWATDNTYESDTTKDTLSIVTSNSDVQTSYNLAGATAAPWTELYNLPLGNGKITTWYSKMFWDVELRDSSNNWLAEGHYAYGPVTTANLMYGYIELGNTATGLATVSMLSVEQIPLVAACSAQSGSNTLTAYTGCFCNDRSMPVLAAIGADFSTAQCASTCATGSYLCYGRGRSEGVSFCAATDLTASHTNENISSCSLLTQTTALNTNFDWNNARTSMSANASLVQGVLQLATSASWR